MTHPVSRRLFPHESIRMAVGQILASGFFVILLGSPAASEPKAAAVEKVDKPVVTGTVSSVDQVYDDLKFVFQLAGDHKGYKTFKETIDTFMEGVETSKPSGWRVYIAADGLHTVASVPVKDEAAFKKFLRNLWDLDVKTAPPPAPSLATQVRRPVQEKLRSLKLKSNERIMFGLTDGFLRYESGYVHFGASIEDVRLAQGGIPAESAKGPTLALRIEGESAAPDRRREAFDKSVQKLLADMKKTGNETDAEFALARAVVELQLAKFELVFADASHVDLGWTTSHQSKNSNLTARVTASKDTSLAKDIEQMGESTDDFAGVSRQGVVMSSAINFPNDRTFTKSLKSVSRQARIVARDAINKDERLNADQKAVDKQFVDLVCDLVDDVAAMPVFNGFARTWANSDGSLTTVGAVKVADGAKYREMLQKFKAQERVGHKSGGGGVEIYKIAVAKWQKDVPELFGKVGAVYIGTSDKAVWCAAGEQALERLEQAIQEAGSEKAKSSAAVAVHAELLPLAKVWDRFRSRHPSDTSPKSKKKEVASAGTSKATTTSKAADKGTVKAGSAKDSKESKQNNGKASDRKESLAQAKSTVSDLELNKIAVAAFQQGRDTIQITLTRKGENAELVVQSDEGILRFIGMVLSKFTKDNLEDQ
jgi:hypothetical protein